MRSVISAARLLRPVGNLSLNVAVVSTAPIGDQRLDSTSVIGSGSMALSTTMGLAWASENGLASGSGVCGAAAKRKRRRSWRTDKASLRAKRWAIRCANVGKGRVGGSGRVADAVAASCACAHGESSWRARFALCKTPCAGDSGGWVVNVGVMSIAMRAIITLFIVTKFIFVKRQYAAH
jgi:hypothetical protein